MQTFEGFELNTNTDVNIEDYLFSLPQNMRHLRSVAVLTDKTFPLKVLADMAEIVQYFRLDTRYITDQSPSDELRFDFLELNKKRAKRTSAITFEQTDEATELLRNTHVVIAGCFDHISSKYQLFLEKTIQDLPQPILLSKDIVSLFQFNVRLTEQTNHYLVLTPDSIVRLCSLLSINTRPLGLPANNWHNLIQLSNILDKPTVCVAPEHIVIAIPKTKVVKIVRVEAASTKYYLYIGLLASLLAANTGSTKEVDLHMSAAARILQLASNNGSRSITLFLKNNS